MISRFLRRRGVAAVAVALTAVASGNAAFSASSDLDWHRLPLTLQPLGVGLSSPRPFSLSFSGLPSISLSVNGALTPSTGEKEVSGGDDAFKCCPGCLDRNAIANAAATVSPSVVNISHVSATRNYYGLMLGKSIGCGTIIDPDGTILTCAHVVVDENYPRSVSKRKVDVTLQDGRQYEGTVLNIDLHSDVAVIKINSKTPLPAAKLGSSCKLRPGEWVVALGCPLSLQNTVTVGIVSCVDRKSSDLGLGGIRREYLQTDCAINEGNSGGPLVNLDGEVIGVNIMKIRDAYGLSFALPINSVTKVVTQFKKNGRVVRPWLGLKMLDLNDMIIQHLREKDRSFPSVKKGVLVPMVTPGSPAERAGFRPGDVVVEFDGRPVETVQQIVDAMGDQAGVAFEACVLRANDVMVTLRVVPVETNPDF